MSFYALTCFFILLAHIQVGKAGNSCEDIDPLACAHMAKQNANLCSEPVLSHSACPKFCGNCPTTCYNCNITIPDVSACNTVTCDKNKMCLMEKITSTRTGHTKYKFGCATESFCDTGMKRDIQSRSLTIDCCDKDLCNVPLTMTTPIIPSTQTTTTTTIASTLTTTATTATTTAFDPCKESPCEHGTCQTNGTSVHCRCQVDWIGRSCDTPDPCSSSPCLHGVCTTLKNSSFQCTCSSGYTGDLCETALDHCISNPCVHGNCSSTLHSYICSCGHGWIGSTCSAPDPCTYSPCYNGLCSGFENGTFYCKCYSGYTGQLCDYALNPCNTNPCLHGTCTPVGRGFICSCQQGWTGTKCSSLIDHCSSSPCLHGQCTSDLMSYKCSCASGYVGSRCNNLCKRDVLVRIDQTLLNYYDDKSIIQFLQHLVQKMHIGYDGVYLEVSTFDGTRLYNKWTLSSFTNKGSMLLSLGNLQRISTSGLPDIFLPINNIYYQGTRGHGDRYSAPDVALIITGPYRSSQYSLKYESDRINAVIPIITVGVGAVNTQTLKSISKDRSHALSVKGLSDLVDDDFVDKVLNIICT